jgi:hypothetical protein
VVGRWSAPEETIKLRDTRELFEGVPRNMQLLYENDFEKDTGLYCPLPAIQGKKSVYIGKGRQQEPEFSFPYSAHHAQWVRAQASFRCIEKEETIWKMPRFNVFFSKNGKTIKAYGIRVHRFLKNGTTRELYIDIKVPKGDFDTIGAELRNEGSEKELLMDDLKIYSFNE